MDFMELYDTFTKEDHTHPQRDSIKVLENHHLSPYGEVIKERPQWNYCPIQLYTIYE